LASEYCPKLSSGKPGNNFVKPEGLVFRILKITIIDPSKHPDKKKYIDLMVELRKHKGLTQNDAEKLIEDPLYLATLMIKAGDADGEVAGAMNSTGDVLRPAFQYVKTMPGISVVSGALS
jgi:phosphate acetyltransferase